jgi:hypothetical protein
MKTLLTWVALFAGSAVLSQNSFGAETAAPEMTVRLALVVAWEGAPVGPINTAALKELRSTVDGVRWIHLMDASLWAREGADTQSVDDMLKALVRKDDITGIHLAGWKSIVEKAGVTHRRKPTFWGNILSAEDCARDCGREVPLAAYSARDVSKIIDQALIFAKDGGISSPKAFMAGGHGSDRKILEAASAAGLKHDFSGVISARAESGFAGQPLNAWISESWSGARIDQNVVAAETASGRVWRYAVNAGQADWQSGDDMARLAKNVVDEARRNKRNEVDVVFLMHGDTAARTAPRVARAFRILTPWWTTAKVTPVPMDLKRFE